MAVLWFHGPAHDEPRAARKAVAAMLKHHPEAASAPTVAVTVIRGWDVGIATRTTGVKFVHTPAQWRVDLGI